MCSSIDKMGNCLGCQGNEWITNGNVASGQFHRNREWRAFQEAKATMNHLSDMLLQAIVQESRMESVSGGQGNNESPMDMLLQAIVQASRMDQRFRRPRQQWITYGHGCFRQLYRNREVRAFQEAKTYIHLRECCFKELRSELPKETVEYFPWIWGPTFITKENKQMDATNGSSIQWDQWKLLEILVRQGCEIGRPKSTRTNTIALQQCC